METKFAHRLKNESDDMTSEKCLSLIISGLDNEAYEPSIFNVDHILQDSFSQEGLYTSDDIEEFLIQAKQTYTTNMANAASSQATSNASNSTANVIPKFTRRAVEPKQDGGGGDTNKFKMMIRPSTASSLFSSSICSL